MTKTKIAAAVLLAITTAGCAGTARRVAPDLSKVRCQELPQWTTKGENGEDLGIYVCFGTEGQLLYAVRVLPKADPALAAAHAENAKLRAELDKAKAPKAKTAAPAPKAAPAAPSAPPAATPLPTLGGTATQP